MEVLGNISLHEQYFTIVIEKILQIFRNNKEILANKSHIIIKKLCGILDPQKVYITFAEKLLIWGEISFISSVVQTLDMILLTDKVKYWITSYQAWSQEGFHYKFLTKTSNLSLKRIIPYYSLINEI
jgi:hypothetical protein